MPYSIIPYTPIYNNKIVMEIQKKIVITRDWTRSMKIKVIKSGIANRPAVKRGLEVTYTDI